LNKKSLSFLPDENRVFLFLVAQKRNVNEEKKRSTRPNDITNEAKEEPRLYV